MATKTPSYDECILVLDDGGDAILTSQDQQKIKLFKEMLNNNSGRRTITTPGAGIRKASAADPNAMPPSFKLGHLGICWISNLHPDFANSVPAKMKDSVEAILSRPRPIVFSSDRDIILDYSLDLAYNSKMLRHVGSGIKIIHPTLEEFNDALEFYLLNADRYRTLGCRTLEELVCARHIHPHHWKAGENGKMGEKVEGMKIPVFVTKTEPTRIYNLPGTKSAKQKRADYWVWRKDTDTKKIFGLRGSTLKPSEFPESWKISQLDDFG